MKRIVLDLTVSDREEFCWSSVDRVSPDAVSNCRSAEQSEGERGKEGWIKRVSEM